MPKFTQIVYLSILIVITNLLGAQTKALVEINNPIINLSYPNKLISIQALGGKNIDGDKLSINYLIDGIFNNKPFKLESIHNINLFSKSSIKQALSRAGLGLVKQMSALPDLIEEDFKNARMSAYVARKCS